MPLISSILVGVAPNGCSVTGYVPPAKKIPSMDSSDILKIQKMRAIARSTQVSNVNTTTRNNGGYSQLYIIQFANRVSVPLCTLQI